MNTKSLLIGIVSFIAGALLVSTAATFEKPHFDSKDSMVEALKTKHGEEFDNEFISQMIVHHESAVEMSKLTRNQSSHQEIKILAEEIIKAQEVEIHQMKQWQQQWGYDTSSKEDH